jgi:hypothetical protein
MNAEKEGEQLVIPEAIRSLLEQRAQYMEWLARLDDVGGQYRPEVAQRVRADYRERLVGVEDELHGHQAELESSLADRQARFSELEQRYNLCAAELEEVELRHQVGEFDDGEWERRKSKHESELKGVVEELDQERDAVAELGSVLVQVTAPSEAAATRHVEPGAWVEPAAEVVKAADVEAEVAFDVGELETEALEESEQTETLLEEEPGEAAGGDDFLDELEFLESLSLDDPESFDAVSKMLEDEGEEPADDEEEAGRGGSG